MKLKRPSSLVWFENVSKKYGPVLALDNVSFGFSKGEIVGFLGPNGAGKTTAMRILSGFFAPTQGRVWIDGIDLCKQPKKAKKYLGYLPESVRFYPDMRVGEFLHYVAKLKDVPAAGRKTHVQEKMALCGLGDVENRLIGRLSKGYRQRVGIAQALIGDPEVIILDEPTSGLDPKQITEIRELIRTLGRERAVILSTHILPEVSMICNRVVMISHGRIVASGTVKELESCLKDRQQLHVRIKGKDHSTAAREALEAVPGIEELHVSEESEDEVCFSLETAREEDLRAHIAQLFVRKNIPLVEIQRGKASLEDVFLHLLKDKKFGGGAL